jgi:hypothetical protein
MHCREMSSSDCLFGEMFNQPTNGAAIVHQYDESLASNL